MWGFFPLNIYSVAAHFCTFVVLKFAALSFTFLPLLLKCDFSSMDEFQYITFLCLSRHSTSRMFIALLFFFGFFYTLQHFGRSEYNLSHKPSVNFEDLFIQTGFLSGFRVVFRFLLFFTAKLNCVFNSFNTLKYLQK